MKLNHAFFLTGMMICGAMLPASAQEKNKGEFHGTLSTGYNRGFGLRAAVSNQHLSPDLKFGLRLAAGWTMLDPGNALDARRIFINNNTNGTPEKKGHAWDIRLDFMKPRPVFGISHSFFVFGPRFSSFVGDFNYVGGNEDFEVRSKQWGAGAGFEHHFHLSPKLDLAVEYGVDLYAPSRLYGHDTSYSPWGDHVNPNNDNENDDREFRYWDADRAIRQPEIMPHLMVGLEFAL